MGKGYANLSLNKEQAKEIAKTFKIAGIKSLKPSEFHVTIMYDVSNPDIDILKSTKTYTAEITGVERMGTKGSKWEAIALELKSPEIDKRHQELKNAGFKHSYDKFKCHMSILYQPNDTDEDVINLVHKLNALPKVLKFENEEFKKIKD